MKTYLAILIALMCLTPVVAQVGASADMEFGYIPIQKLSSAAIDTSRLTEESDVFYSMLSVKFVPSFADFLFLEGKVTTIMELTSTSAKPNFTPFLDSYLFGFGITFDIFTIGFRHECSHPVMPWGYQIVAGDAAYEAVYVNMHIEF